MKALLDRLRDGSLLFFWLPIGYFLLYGPYGFADTDQGFVPGLAWRVLNGQVPYIDFCYVRPPVTPYLHALELWIWPDKLELIGMRLDYYLMLWATVYWGVRALAHVQGRGQAGPTQPTNWWLAVFAFLFGAHNFAPMPWHTIDGIFFASLGLYLLAHPHPGWRALLGLWALALAGLCKQPFAILLPLGMVGLFVLQPSKNAFKIIGIALATMLLTAIALLTFILPAGFMREMLLASAGSSGLGELWDVGVQAYLWPGGVIFAGTLGLHYTLRAQPRWQVLLRWSILVAIAVGYPILLGIWSMHKGVFVPPKLGLYHALLLCGVWEAVVQWRQGERGLATMLVLLSAMSWASGISWGYPWPAAMVVGGWYGLQAMLQRGPTGLQVQPRRWALIAAATAIGFFGMYRYPYRDAPRAELVAGAGDIFPALNYIQTSPQNIAQLHEFWAFRQLFPESVVLPAMPAADYLMQTVPSFPIDWEHDGEIGASKLQALRNQLNRPGNVVLVELSRLEEAHSPNPRYRCTLLADVLAHWTPDTLGAYFQVFTYPTKPD